MAVEELAYGILSLIWWVSSCTFLLPFVLLLRYSEAVQKKWFSLFFTLLGPLMVPKFIPIRKALFQLLEEKLGNRKKSETLKILEIGIGNGANFKYYPENSSLIAVDMNPNFGEPLKKNLEQFPEIEIEKLICAMAENMAQLEDCSVDAVVCTHVICSLSDVSKALGEVRRVLKPGGLFLFLEHVAFRDNLLGLAIQHFATPLWSVYFAGCCLNRHSEASIRKTGFSEVDCRMIDPPILALPLFFRPHIYGIARK